jgi:hypothetical protein
MTVLFIRANRNSAITKHKQAAEFVIVLVLVLVLLLVLGSVFVFEHEHDYETEAMTARLDFRMRACMCSALIDYALRG